MYFTSTSRFTGQIQKLFIICFSDFLLEIPLEIAVTGHKCIPCPENWLQYGENCYFFSEEWKTWQESKAKCLALESRLLKIESKEKLVKIDIYIDIYIYVYFFFSLTIHSSFYCGLDSHSILPLVEAVHAPSLEVFKARLDRALGDMV
uniref:C-type lectin domain-containing protein n=1 Tax=Amazona collaria TaxID=241587 RepID=A0A8B9EUI2_9PSIT